MSERVLRQAEAGALLPLYVVYGEASVLVRRVVTRLVDAALPSCGLPAFNHSVYPGDSAEAALSAARTLPMMADRRLVVVQSMEEASDAFYQGLLDLVGEEGAAGTTLILTGAAFPKVRKGGSNWGVRLKNALKKHPGEVIDLSAGSTSPVDFVRECAAARGKRVAAREAGLLVEIVGKDLDRLDQEVEKICLYAGDEAELGEGAIHAVTTLLSEAVVWDLTKGLATGDAALAIASLHRLLSGQGGDGDDQPDKLMGLIIWQLREVLYVIQLARQGRSESEIRRTVRMRGDTLQGILAGIRRGTPPTAVVLEELLLTNRQMHASPAGARRVLEALVVRLGARTA
ncbi:MAG: hypothetical protein JXX28_10845 [Deltaproteobacteria bacterium]|nr:hypothetical protein [Deltaproteobacteria bacterium]